ncbi:hypothetical protein B4U37_15195 [Sutcliffiella horikoshii]|uniref:Uncharacterized protein n=1 Tax=Sutcliffiella horikoshii TaxID=79883 RepID=A0ABN4ZG27_9BACI|nr:hypothetical protein B4U37_15195 [Sutcliffiella horikoshii]
MEQKAKTPAGEVATMLRPRNEVRRLKVAPRKAKPFAEINNGVYAIKIIFPQTHHFSYFEVQYNQQI